MPFEPADITPQINYDQTKIMISRKKINFKNKNTSDQLKVETQESSNEHPFEINQM